MSIFVCHLHNIHLAGLDRCSRVCEIVYTIITSTIIHIIHSLICPKSDLFIILVCHLIQQFKESSVQLLNWNSFYKTVGCRKPVLFVATLSLHATCHSLGHHNIPLYDLIIHNIYYIQLITLWRGHVFQYSYGRYILCHVK